MDDKTGAVDIKRRFFRPRNNPYMPLEFSGAAFRFGHSQIRGIYDLSAQVVAKPIFAPGDAVGPLDDLRGRRPLPAGWAIDWALFFEMPGAPAPQPSRLIDSKLVPALFDLPGAGEPLPLRNLKRGQALELPSGQDVARHMKVDVLATQDLDGAPELTPLWFYVLKEAEKRAGGNHVGPVAGRIVAEVLLGLLELDKQSYFSVEPDWQPWLDDADGNGIVGMPELIAYATS